MPNGLGADSPAGIDCQIDVLYEGVIYEGRDGVRLARTNGVFTKLATNSKSKSPENLTLVFLP